MSKGTAFEIQWTPPPAVRVLDEEGDSLGEAELLEAPEDFDVAIRGEDESKFAATTMGPAHVVRVEVVLQRVQQQSMLDFGSLPVLENPDDEPYIGEFVLRNESPDPITVSAERFSTRNGFEIACCDGDAVYEVPAEGAEVCRIAWRPLNAGGVRQSISFSLLNDQRRRIRVGAFVCGVAKAAAKDHKRPGKPRSNRAASARGPLSGAAPRAQKTGVPAAQRNPQRARGVENASRRVNKPPLSVSDKDNRAQRSPATSAAGHSSVVAKPGARNAARSARPAASLRLRRPTDGADAAQMLAKVGQKDLKTHHVVYDERWMEKQEKGFAAWLNFVMDPEMSDVSEDAHAEAAPCRALAELARKQRHAALQRRAFVIMHNPEMEVTSLQIDREIASGGISIRADRDLFKDLGLRRLVLDMLFCYQDAWLRIGLDTVLGGHTLQHHAARKSMKRFAATYFLGDPELDEEYRATKKGLFDENPEYKQELRRRTLRRFLKLVIFLDRAKQASLIDHPSCLFRVDSPIKSSADMLINFAKEFLAGEGNVLRHLQNSCAYTLHHVQRKLDEFDFRVNSISVDLRDGLRLARAVELLTDNKDRTLSALMRTPAVSRLQKLHNTDVALKELEHQGISLVFSHNAMPGAMRLQMPVKAESITNRDIVDGDRRKTLALLWKMILKWKLDGVLPEEALRDETHRIDALHGKTASRILAKSMELAKHHRAQTKEQRGEITPDEDEESEHADAAMSVLLRWCQSICAHHGMRVANFTTSMASGRALCLLIHHYHPALLPREAIAETTVDLCRARHPESYAADLDWTVRNVQDMSRADYRKSLENERANFQLVNECATALGSVPVLLPQFDSENVPEEKMMLLFVTYLSSRLLVSRDEISAATRIQNVWIRYRRGKFLRELGEKSLGATLTLQRHARGMLVRRRARLNRMALKLQAFARGFPMRLAYCELREAATTLQAFFRGRATYEIYNAVLNMIVQVQAVVRRHQACMRLRAFKAQEAAATAIQAFVRGHTQRMNLLYEMSAAVSIQALVRGFLDRNWQKRAAVASVQLQAFVRGTVFVRHGFLTLKEHAVSMQAVARGVLARRQLARQRAGALKLQSMWRCHAASATFYRTRAATVRLQTFTRQQRCYRTFQSQRSSALVLQNTVRGYFARKRYALTEDACIQVQAFLRMAHARSHFRVAVRAAIKIQACARQDRIKGMYHFVRESIIEIQAVWRGVQSRRQLLAQHSAAVGVQRAARGLLARRACKVEMRSIICIQSVARMRLAGREAALKQRRIIVVQSLARGWSARHEMQMQTAAATTFAALVRMHCARMEFAHTRAAAVAIQAWTRRCLAEQELDRAQFAAVRLQAAVRMWGCAKMLSTHRAAATRIAACARAMLAQKYLRQAKRVAVFAQAHARRLSAQHAYAGRKEEIVAVQAASRALLARKRFLTTRQGLVRLQSLVRGQQAQQQLRQAKRAAVFAQSHARRLNAQRAYAEQKSDIIAVQAAARALLARKRFLTTKQGLVRLQSLVRGQQAQKQLRQAKRVAVFAQSHARRLNAELAFAAEVAEVIQVQAAARTVLARKRFTSLRRGIIVAQRLVRAHQASVQAQRHLVAVVRIQSVLRGARARAAVAHKKACIVRLQAFARRARAEEELRHGRRAGVQIQTAFRGFAARKQFFVARQSSCVLQSVVRMWMCKRQLAASRQASVRLQAAWRARLARKQLADARSAAVSIQAWARGAQVREMWLGVRAAAVAVQACARMWAARSRFCAQRAAVVSMQAAWRGHAAREQIALEDASATRLQAWARTSMATAKFRRAVESASRIQACARGVATRAWFREQRAAARSVQSFTRMAIARARFAQSLRDIVVAQSAVRRLQASRRAHERRENVVRVQAAWRRALVLRYAKMERLAVVRMQALVRGGSARRQAAVLRRSVVTTQAFARMLAAQREAMRRLRSVVALQAVVRGWRVREDLREFARDIARAQSWIRMRQARRAFCAQREAACKVQRFAHKYCLAHLAQMRGFCKLQAVYRGWKVRTSRSKALIRIQRRLAAARAKATDDMTLGARTKSALAWLLESKNLGAIRNACETLEVSTRYPTMAEAFLESTASDVLFALVHSCNRSLPHMKLLETALQILLQAAKQDRARNYERLFANKEASASSILDLMQMFRDQVRIFAKALALLEYFCSDSSRAINYIVDDPELQRRLHQIEHILRRKCDINKQHRPGRPSAALSERTKKEQFEVRQHAKLRRLLDELDQY